MFNVRGHTPVLGAFGAPAGMVNEGTMAVLQVGPAGSAFAGHDPFIAFHADEIGLPRSGAVQAQPNSCSRSSSMPKWWAISWITVMATSSTTWASLSQTSKSAPR